MDIAVTLPLEPLETLLTYANKYGQQYQSPRIREAIELIEREIAGAKEAARCEEQ
jgi:hypothetical protein